MNSFPLKYQSLHPFGDSLCCSRSTKLSHIIKSSGCPWPLLWLLVLRDPHGFKEQCNISSPMVNLRILACGCARTMSIYWSHDITSDVIHANRVAHPLRNLCFHLFALSICYIWHISIAEFSFPFWGFYLAEEYLVTY